MNKNNARAAAGHLKLLPDVVHGQEGANLGLLGELQQLQEIVRSELGFAHG